GVPGLCCESPSGKCPDANGVAQPSPGSPSAPWGRRQAQRPLPSFVFTPTALHSQAQGRRQAHPGSGGNARPPNGISWPMILCSAVRQRCSTMQCSISIPDVTLVDRDPVLLANAAELLLERHHSVVIFLILDIFPQRLHMGWADRKRAISGLPMESLQLRLVLLDPLRTLAFELANQRGDIDRATQAS